MDSDDFDRTPPISLFLSGESFFRSAQYLRQGLETKELRLRFEMPIYYLYSHALELILKGFLRSKGLPSSKLKSRRYGHSLRALWDACISNGLRSHPAKIMLVQQTVELLDPFATEFEFRYVKVGFKSLPTVEAIEDALSDLMAAVRPHCEATAQGPISDR